MPRWRGASVHIVSIKMRNYHILTIGCQMNQAESERLGALLSGCGLKPTDIVPEADLILVNTCVVRQSAQDRVESKIELFQGIKTQNPHTLLVVTGCLVDGNIDQLQQRFPQVDCFFPPGKFEQFNNWAKEQGLIGKPLDRTTSVGPVSFVPIIQGCNNFCSYCIVPYRRGREQSRATADILQEISQLTTAGVKEVTLLGQNVNAYGKDLVPDTDLSALLTALNKMDGLKRIRFLTNHPKDMSPGLISAMSGLDKVCEHLNLPLQAGNDDVLRAMKRGYTSTEYRRLVSSIRETVPQIALSTDIIVGFPGETEEQFQCTYELIRELRFDTVHTSMYSPRPGTFAARKLKDNVKPSIKKQRQQKIEAIQETIAGELNRSLIGKTVEILVEGTSRERWFGRTRSNKIVFFEDGSQWLGQLVNVHIEQAGPWWLMGKLNYEPEKSQ